MNINNSKPCREDLKRKSQISRKWKHFSQAELQKPIRAQVNWHTVWNITLHNRAMLIVNWESGFEQGTFVSDVPVSSLIHSRPPSGQNAIVMATATISATTAQDSSSSPKKKQARDLSANRKFVQLSANIELLNINMLNIFVCNRFTFIEFEHLTHRGRYHCHNRFEH